MTDSLGREVLVSNLSVTTPSAAPRRLRWLRAQWLGLDRWSVLVVGAAFWLALPVLTVLLTALRPAGPVWEHLTETVLADYVQNSVLLMLGVGVGTLLIGVPTAFLATLGLMLFFGGTINMMSLFALIMALGIIVISLYPAILSQATGPTLYLLASIMGGAGWALAGFCPGPALASLGWSGVTGLSFTLAMAGGMIVHARLAARRSLQPA